MRYFFKKSSRGFTLTEMMVAIGISSIIFTGVFAILRVGSEQSNLSQTKMYLQDTAREAVYKMAQEIRQTAPDRVTIPMGNASIQFQVPDPTALIGADYAINWAGAHMIQYAIGGDTNDQIIRTDQTTNQASVLANDVTGLQFTGNLVQPTLVTVTVSVQKTLTSGRLVPATPLQLTAQTEVRNL